MLSILDILYGESLDSIEAKKFSSIGLEEKISKKKKMV